MKTVATVKEIRDGFAVVEVQRASACEGCHKASEGEGCSVCSLMGGNRSFSALAKNGIGAKAGDRVEVETDSKKVLINAALVFLLPLVLCGLGYGIAKQFTQSELVPVAVAVCTMVASFIGLRVWSERKKREPEIIITNRLDTER